MTPPLVSIILPTYNRADWLPKSIESVLEQTYDCWELIIWDDGSKDDTQKVLKSYGDSRIKCSYAENHGKSYALNQALQKASGKYVAFLDDDDQWYPEKLSLQVTTLEKHREIDLLFTDFYRKNLSTQSEGPYFESEMVLFEKLKTLELSDSTYLITSGIPEMLLTSNFVLPSSTVMKRVLIERIGNFNVNLRNSVDLEYWWRLGLAKANFAYINQILLFRNKPPNSLSSNSAIAHKNHIKALGVCFEKTLECDRKELLPYVKQASITASQRLIRFYALTGEREEAMKEFSRSIGFGLTRRSIYLLLGALLGPRISSLVRMRRCN